MMARLHTLSENHAIRWFYRESVVFMRLTAARSGECTPEIAEQSLGVGDFTLEVADFLRPVADFVSKCAAFVSQYHAD